MKVNTRQLKKWIAALDSGKYEQGKYKLQSAENSYCCLGVACKVLIPEIKQIKNGSGWLQGWMPDYQQHSPRWLKQISNDFSRKSMETLPSLNDGLDFSFAEIATLLELVYIHKMLD